MFLAVPTGHVPFFSLRKLFVLALSICLALISPAGLIRAVPVAQSNEGLRFELPANGNLRVENLRGGVIAELWTENYVLVSAITDSGQASRSPAIVQRSDGLLSVRVPRGALKAARINLELKIPAHARVAIVTGDGSVAFRGSPAALLIQTVSGEIRVQPAAANLDVVAESKTGNVSSSFFGAVVNQTNRPQLQARLGGGGRNVRLFSQAGNITLERTPDIGVSGLRPISSSQPSPSVRLEPLDPAEVTKPTQRPELIDPGKSTKGAGTPAPVTAGSEEISEGDVIRVDTELVSVNVSVIDRGTDRAVNDLTKTDFRLHEDNVEQQIAHFDSSSAPFNLVLLIDLSGSTAKKVDLIKSAAKHFIDAARPFDRIGVITFAGAQVVVSPLTSDRQILHQRIAAIQRPDGSTKLYDSLAFAMDEVFRQARDSRRNAIVVMSDGLDSVLPNVTGEPSNLTYEEVLGRVKEFDGVVYSIWVETQSYVPLSPKDIQQETFDLAHDRMKEFADSGGGAFYECQKLEDLAGAYGRVVADLGTLYTLSYRPTNKVRDGSWRTIKVNVNRANTVARGKRGYYAK